MGTSGKSKRPPPQRDNRIDSTPPVPRQEAIGRAALRVTRSARPGDEVGDPAQGAALELDVARLKAERASDADEIGAMLVRVAAAERAREVAEQRATGLEKWTEDLEAKVAEARTRGDDLEEELQKVRRERDALASSRETGGGGARAASVARDAVAKIIGTLEELEKHESQSALARRRAFDQAREFLATQPRTPSKPPSTKDVPTVPPVRSPSKRPRRASAAPHSSAVPTPTTPHTPLTLDPLSAPIPAAVVKAAEAVTAPPAPPADEPKHEMLTFEDLDLGD